MPVPVRLSLSFASESFGYRPYWHLSGVKQKSILDELVKSLKRRISVIPAKAGIQFFQIRKNSLDSGFHRSDDFLRKHHSCPPKKRGKVIFPFPPISRRLPCGGSFSRPHSGQSYFHRVIPTPFSTFEDLNLPWQRKHCPPVLGGMNGLSAKSQEFSPLLLYPFPSRT